MIDVFKEITRIFDQAAPELPRAHLPRVRCTLIEGMCAYCDGHRDEQMMPPHDPSPRCESGKRKHCTCDVCF